VDELEKFDANVQALITVGAPPPTDSYGRTEEFARFYRESIGRLVTFLVWQGARPADAVDIAQETMIKAYARWTTIDAPLAWARRVASREWGRLMARIEEDPVEQVPERCALLPPSTAIDELEQRHDILRLLATLPARQRQVMAWILDGYSCTEIAFELAMKPDAVRASLLKARRALANLLSHEGGAR
jgi:RNA polymerase sigma factor (sigma-70 family)